MESLLRFTVRNKCFHGFRSILASASRIHVIASMDHVSGALVMDQRQRVRANWVCAGNVLRLAFISCNARVLCIRRSGRTVPRFAGTQARLCTSTALCEAKPTYRHPASRLC